MPVIFQYLLKLSISLALVYLFYQFFLRKLTFYGRNRWYLLGYTLLSFFVPFINITAVIEKNEWTNNKVINLIPAIEGITADTAIQNETIFQGWNQWNWLLLVLITGILIMLVRLLIQLFSLRRMIRKTSLLSGDEVKIYQVDQRIIPFSFGNSIFINPDLHSEAELKEIIHHEFIHVKQKHTIDIIWSEWLCILNWYNPFAWLIRKAIRQNLEFIADSKVLEEGICRKQYQYLLLKVIGNDHFSIANQFNLSSLKKRIAMMNKIRSAKIHLVKFLFMLPLLVVLLVAFRNKQDAQTISGAEKAIPGNKNFRISRETAQNKSDTIPDAPANSKGYYIDIKDNKGQCTVVVKDKNKKPVERVDLLKWNDRQVYYENLYGEILAPPKFIQKVSPVTVIATQSEMIPTIAEPVMVATTVTSSQSVNTTVTEPVIAISTINASNKITTAVTEPVTAVSNVVSQNKISKTVSNSPIVSVTSPSIILPVEINPGEKILELIIYNTSTTSHLGKLVEEAKAKGIELEFEDMEYNDNGQLTSISGNMKKERATSNFRATDFKKVILTLYKSNGKYSIRIAISDKKEIS